ncbi:hypothetical protein [Acrocarpospora catenulata]|uniref:hypothetical protein n=1 Tax=Acrocarpospora catenulata TaxID=2836182 RepID=UPI001BD9CB21|nr:hypothetical protein [Acrocarpospora catenulata]
MYAVEYGDEAQEQADVLPFDALAPFLEVLAVLGVAPWSGKSLNEDNPNANILTLAFGPRKQGMVTYMILEDRRHVEILKVMWLGL